MVGAEALKVAQSLRTHRRRKEPVLIRSVAVYWMYETATIPRGPAGNVRVSEERMQLALTPFARAEEIENERAEWRARLEAVRASDQASEADTAVAVRFDYWSQLRLDASRRGAHALKVTLPAPV